MEGMIRLTELASASLSKLSVLALLAMMLSGSETSAQSYAIPGADRFFRIEWEQRQTKHGQIVAGYVYNSHGASADRVMLRIEGLDAAGNVVSTTTSYVMGTVPRFGRSYFEVRVPEGATTYRLTVLSFDWINGTGG
jgi:hypothetical protein